MAAPVMAPRDRRAGGACSAFVEPDLTCERAAQLASIAKALADPTRLRILDAIRKSAPEAVCQCELLPLFEMSQPALAKHLKLLTRAKLLATERRGVWVFYCLADDAPLAELSDWLAV